MSNYETRDNTGRLFKVEDDKKRDRGPDYSGTALIDGREYFMDAWLKTAESGRKWMSFSFKAKQQNRGAQHRNGTTADEREDKRRRDRDNFEEPPF